METRSLREIALEAGTDKERGHHYAAAYERHFAHLRDRAITLLEIGVGGYEDADRGGASLRMWKAYFPRGRIIGIDIHDKTGLAEDRISILQGDQGDPIFLDSLAARYGPFDIVIDDGSHFCNDVIRSFRCLFPHVKDGGVYAIEDLQTSYWARPYGGSSTADRSDTTMTFLHGLADGLNHAEFDIARYAPSESDLWVKSMTFYHNQVFIERGSNAEPSNVLPPHPRPRELFAVPTPSPPNQTASQSSPRLVRRTIRRWIPKPIRAAVTRSLRSLSRAIRS